MAILHPDQLLSATTVADSFSCTRRSALQDRVKATTEASAPLVYGTMLHEVFQAALLANRWDLHFLASLIDRTVAGHVEDLYSIKVGLHNAREHMQSKMPELAQWAEVFVGTHARVS
jgi:DNA replication ATP-dependent helicase Dna2